MLTARMFRIFLGASFCILLGVSTQSPADPFGLDERPENLTCIAPDRPPASTSITLQSVLNLGSDPLRPPLKMVQPPGDPTRWFLLMRGGVVYELQNGDTFIQTGTFLDITDRVVLTFEEGPAEFGLLGIAVHPEFAQNTEVYVYYTAFDTAYAARVSRFKSLDGGLTLDPDSEEVVFSLPLSANTHVAGDIAFGSDGYLYIGIGDNKNSANSQDLNSLKGKILRIDVTGQSGYAIPADNPWAAGGGAGEIFAYGFRNPWRWSFDTQTGDLWVGDAGESLWEEFDFVVKGGNYGWPIREGAHCYNATSCDTTGLIDPVVEYPHDEGSAAAVGGYVYHGSGIPNLQGAYVYMDQPGGRMWALQYDEQGNPDPQIIIDDQFGGLSMAEGLDGELYKIKFGSISRLVPQGTPPPNNFPQLLSATGCVDPSDPSQPATGTIRYDVNSPLWSDGSVKERWMAIPDSQQIGIDASGDFLHPIGTVLVKSFRIAGQLVETRLFIHHDDGEWGGYSFEWNDSQTDALLLPGAKSKIVNGQTWRYPSRSECMQCHSIAAGRSLGPEILQLNGDFVYPSTGIEANQLATLDHIQLFSAGLPDTVENLPALPETSDLTATLDSRARAYLHSNCSICHRPGGTGQGPADFRYQVAGVDMGILNAKPTQGNLGVSNTKLLVPGNPALSLISIRMHALTVGRMPPLASSLVDAQGTLVVDQWISSGLGFGIPDSDADEIADNLDNCSAQANPAQRDTDSDGFGNLCDADLNNSGFVNFADLALFKTSFGTGSPDADFDGDGIVNFNDLAIFKSGFGKSPGPGAVGP